MNRRLGASFFLLLILLVGVVGYASYRKSSQRQDKATVNQATVSRGNIAQVVQATGTLVALRTIQVGPQVSGTVKSLYVDFNSVVKKDQVLAELDPALFQLQVDVQAANIARDQSDIDSQGTQLQNELKSLQRTQDLFARGLVTQQQLETAQLAVMARRASVASLQKQLVQTQANVARAKLNLSYCTVTSPIDGVIVNRFIDVGQTVQGSTTAPRFFTIATELTTLKLSAGIDEADIGYIRPRMNVTFTVDSVPNQTFSGSVETVRINAQVQNNVVTFPVWITVQNPDLRLRPSMTANLKIIIDEVSNVMRLPNQALRFRPINSMHTWLGSTPPPAADASGSESAQSSKNSPTEDTGEGADDDLAAATAVTADEARTGGRDAARLDDLFVPVQKPTQPGQIWVYDETAVDPSRKLRRISVRWGLTDGQFSQLISGEGLTPGMQVVTGITPPPSAVVRRSAPTSMIPQQNRPGRLNTGPSGGRGGGD